MRRHSDDWKNMASSSGWFQWVGRPPRTPFVGCFLECAVHISINCSEIFKRCWSPDSNFMKQQPETETLKLIWVYGINSSQDVALSHSRVIVNTCSLNTPLELLVQGGIDSYLIVAHQIGCHKGIFSSMFIPNPINTVP